MNRCEGFELPKREEDSHKGCYGHLLTVGGSRGMAGAACLMTLAALRSGAGLVSAAVPVGVWQTVAAKLPEAMTLPLKEDETGALCEESLPDLEPLLLKATVAAIGCGMKSGPSQKSFFSRLLRLCEIPVVIDADGLNCLSPAELLNRNSPAVLTPHAGEMARLCGRSVDEIEQNREETAQEFARRYNCVLLLKGHKTVVAAPDLGIYINETGNPALAKGGSGDVLTGIIAGFLAMGLPPFRAACLGAYYHGLAADALVKRVSEHSVLASDIIDELKYVFLHPTSKGKQSANE